MCLLLVVQLLILIIIFVSFLYLSMHPFKATIELHAWLFIFLYDWFRKSSVKQCGKNTLE